MSIIQKSVAAVALSGIAVAVSSAYAAGFQLAEMSAANQGRAMAGIGVVGDDLSALHYNAAGMTLLPGTRIQVNGSYVAVNAEFEGVNGETENGRKKGQLLPAGYFTHQVDDQWWVGLAMTVPYGMGTDYEREWVGADKGNKSMILTVDINPNVAWKMNDYVSFGAGLSLQYARATLGKSVQSGMVNAIVKGDSWAWGWNVGVMIQPVETVRVGLSYRSHISHNAEGDTSFALTSQAKNKMDYLPETMKQALALINGKTADMDVRIKTPDTITLSATWEATPELRISGTARWSKWSNFRVLNIENTFNTGMGAMVDAALNANGSTQVENNWEDTWFVSLGADYKLNNQWTVRGGVAFDKDPIADQTKRMAVIPDTNRLWLALGASYKHCDNVTFDFGATYIKGIGDSDLYHDGQSKPFGDYKSLDSYIVAASMQYRF